MLEQTSAAAASPRSAVLPIRAFAVLLLLLLLPAESMCAAVEVVTVDTIVVGNGPSGLAVASRLAGWVGWARQLYARFTPSAYTKPTSLSSLLQVPCWKRAAVEQLTPDVHAALQEHGLLDATSGSAQCTLLPSGG